MKLTPEEELSKEDIVKAWDLAYCCLHWGADNARPIEVDQRILIMLIHELIKEKEQ